MADRFVVSHIKRLPMFQTLSEHELERLATVFRVNRYEPGEYVFRQWQVSQGLYMFVTGQAVLLQQRPDGTQHQIGMVGPNQYLNEAALTRETVESASLYTTATAIVLFLGREAYKQYLAQPAPTQPQEPALAPFAPQPIYPSQPTQPTPSQQTLQSLGGQGLPNFGRIAPQVQMQPPAAPQPPLEEVPKPQPQPQPPPRGQMRVRPEEKTFGGKRPDETVILMTRRHWISWIRQSALAIFLAVLLLILATVIPTGVAPLLILAVTFVFPIGTVIVSYLNWHDDWLIVTNQRVLHIEQHWLRFSTEVSELPIKGIQSINADLPAGDPLAYAFRYGIIDIRTAGNAGNITMDYVGDPEAVRDVIFKHREQVTSVENKERQRQELKAVLDAEFGGASAPEAANAQSAPSKPPTAPRDPPGLLATRYVNAQGETVYRKHWLFWLRKLMIPGLPLTLLSLVLFVFGLTSPNLADVRVLVLIGAFVLFLIGSVSLYFADWDWRHDLYIVGDNAVTLIHRRPFFVQDEDSRLLLERVDNILTERSGLLRKVFNFGDVKLLLVGDEQPHIFKNVPNPQNVREEISQRQKRAVQREKEEDQRRQREEMVEAIRLYHDQYGVPSSGQPTQGDQQPKLMRRPINFPRVPGSGK